MKKCRFNDEKIYTVLNDCLASCPLNTNWQRTACEDCIHSYDGKPCRRWINCLRYEHLKKQKKSGKNEYDFWQWYIDHFRADCSGAPDIICNG